MSDHDPICEQRLKAYDTYRCTCTEIHEARADERERMRPTPAPPGTYGMVGSAEPIWLRLPDTCDATAVRDGEEEACGKVAVAVAFFGGDEEFPPESYPVCKHHARGREMYPLTDIIRIARGETK